MLLGNEPGAAGAGEAVVGGDVTTAGGAVVGGDVTAAGEAVVREVKRTRKTRGVRFRFAMETTMSQRDEGV